MKRDSEDPAARLARQLLAAGIAFQEPEVIEKYYESLKGLFIATITEGDPKSGMYVDLNALPTHPLDLKKIVIKWLIQVNLPRIKLHQEPVMPLSVLLKCPVWKIIPPPIRKLKMTPEGTFGKPSVTTLGKKSKSGTINKK